jgi:hypothetical protein
MFSQKKPPIARIGVLEVKKVEVSMRRSRGIFNSDQVNRAGMWCPASELMRADEVHYRECKRRDSVIGMPVNIQHDMHRLVGWSRPLGLYVDGAMVRVLGLIEKPESSQEKAGLDARAGKYWEQYHREGVSPFRDDIVARAHPADVSNGQFLLIEAAAVVRTGVAAELYPDLFTPNTGFVDKHGLVDYRHLLDRTRQVQPGVFHEPIRDILLFAHRMFRRSFSHRNALNSYFLQSFSVTAQGDVDLSVRIKLDPDLLGHPASAREVMELEYWRGPRYSDDIAAIPKGVAEHKADERSRFYEGIDRTQIWWKAPESRQVDGAVVRYRTFEVEELVENTSDGLGGNHFGCRYAHAEFSGGDGAITHFDGAIRGYAEEAYLDRIESSIDRAGKQADYTKVFRFDGAMDIACWKRLLSDFFRGNKLIPEYLGAEDEGDGKDERAEDAGDVTRTSEEPDLVALISLEDRSVAGSMQLFAELAQEFDGELIPYVEVGVGAVADFLRSRIDLSDITAVGFKDGILNMSRLAFGAANATKDGFHRELGGLADAMLHDIERALVHRAAIPLAWEVDGLLITLTIAGNARKVATLLRQLPFAIDPGKDASQWIEAMSELIKEISQSKDAPVIWNGVSHGILSIERSGTVEQQMRMPDNLLEKVLAKGNVRIERSDKNK